MTELQASRTLVKSPPELWAECSDAASLARHLGQFGEIRITRLDPETAVAWEGERARGTVRIEPSGWGTKVILTAVAVTEEPTASAAVPEEEPTASAAVLEEEPTASAAVLEEEPALPAVAREEPDDPTVAPAESGEEAEAPRRRRLRWPFARRRAPDVPPAPEAVAPEPEAVAPEPEPEVVEAAPAPEPSSSAPDTEAALTAALDSLGQAHHRPYSRS
jgi:hypothetical protein